MTRRFTRAALIHGTVVGLLLPLVALLYPLAAGDLWAWFDQGAVYGLMPVFAVLGIPAFLLTRRLRKTYEARGDRPMQFTNGLLLGGWLCGATLMWLAQDGQPLVGRLLGSASGGVMLVAFWLWIGSILAHFQPGAESGSAAQSQTLTSRPK